MSNPVKLHRRQKQTSALIGKRGKIFVWTMIRVPTKAFSSQAPYPVVIVKFDGGGQAVGQLVDSQEENLFEGQEVIAVLRRSSTEDKEGIISYTIKYKPL